MRPTWPDVVRISSWMMLQEAGGLKIIGTERHESRRDNQLRGRSGRQGDPGRIPFLYFSEDDLMRLFGSERLMSVFNTLGVRTENRSSIRCSPVRLRKHRRRSRAITFGIRKNLLEYDQVMNEQREIIYEKDVVFWTERACEIPSTI